MENLHPQRGFPDYQTCWASGEERVCSCSTQSGTRDLRSSRHVLKFHPAYCVGRSPFPEASYIWLDCRKGSYKSFHRIFRLRGCFLSKLNFRAPQTYQDQQSRHRTGQWSTATYGPIQSLGLVEIKTLKAYIETNLANKFIRPLKSPANTPILFERKSNISLRLCVDYWGLNNLTIKNRYLLTPIEEWLDRLERAKQFTQLDFTSSYH